MECDFGLEAVLAFREEQLGTFPEQIIYHLGPVGRESRKLRRWLGRMRAEVAVVVDDEFGMIDGPEVDAILGPAASDLGRAYLRIKSFVVSVDFHSFAQCAELAVMCEFWLRRVEGSHPFTAAVQDWYDGALANLFFGIEHDGFMPLVGEDGRVLPQALNAYRQVSIQAPHTLTGWVARRYLERLEENHWVPNEEIRTFVEGLLEKG